MLSLTKPNCYCPVTTGWSTVLLYFPDAPWDWSKAHQEQHSLFWMKPQLRTRTDKTSACNSWLRAGWWLLQSQFICWSSFKAVLTLFPAGHGPEEQTVVRAHICLSSEQSSFAQVLQQGAVWGNSRSNLAQSPAAYNLSGHKGRRTATLHLWRALVSHAHLQDYQPPSSPHVRPWNTLSDIAAGDSQGTVTPPPPRVSTAHC